MRDWNKKLSVRFTAPLSSSFLNPGIKPVINKMLILSYYQEAWIS